MNTILDVRKVHGVWLVGIRMPDGTPFLINHVGTVEEAIEKARRAEPEPA